MATYLKSADHTDADPSPACDECSREAGFVLKSGFPAPGRRWYPVYGAPCTVCGRAC